MSLLSDLSLTFYILVIAIVVVLGVVWVRNKRKNDLFAFGLGVVVLLGLIIADQTLESPREQATRRMQEMAKASESNNWDGVFTHLADNFVYEGEGGSKVTKQQLRERVNAVKDFADAKKGFTVSGFQRGDAKQIDENNIEIGFMAKVKENDATLSYVKAKFTKQGNGDWLMSGFTIYEPAKRTERRKVPGLD